MMNMDDVKIDNLLIWGQVDTSDPAELRKVNQRGGFLSIDAYPQIRKATKVFGPMGIGFGLKDVVYEIVKGDCSSKNEPDKIGDILIMKSIFWYQYPQASVIGEIPMYNQGEFGVSFSNDETFKKLMTNSISKALSYLGFNYDVFCGAWDDDKYEGRPDVPAPAWMKDNLETLLAHDMFTDDQRLAIQTFQINAGWSIVSVKNSIDGCIKRMNKSAIKVPRLLTEGEGNGVSTETNNSSV